MKLFVLAIGGTGSRVLRSMVMQFAAGIVPRDEKGNEIKQLTVVPIIIDPHMNNKAVQSANKLLEDYRKIRKETYGDDDRVKGFFSVKIDTLRNVASSEEGNYRFNDSFIFDMPEVSNSKFKEFLDLDSMEPADRLFSKMIFSQEELNTEMSEGFYGSPNIGTVALNVFQQSDSFKALKQAIKDGDRMFFIGSIFGGTGAAGMPMLISNFRQNKEKDSLAHAPMGALIVMPYFSIEQDDESPISEADFIVKTKTALRYYIDNLNPYVNNIYYAADTASPQAFKNDPGKGNQTTNKSHFVEYIGGLAIINFLSRKFDPNEVWEKNFEKNRIEAAFKSRRAGEYALNKNETRNQFKITFSDIDEKTRDLIMMPSMKFHVLDRFIKGHLGSLEGKPFAKENGIVRESISSELEELLLQYNTWLEEMFQHGDHAHNLNFFSDLGNPATSDFSTLFNGIERQKGFVGKKSLGIDDIVDSLNAHSSKMRNDFKPNQEPLGKFLQLADIAIEEAISKNLKVN